MSIICSLSFSIYSYIYIEPFTLILSFSSQMENQSSSNKNETLPIQTTFKTSSSSSFTYRFTYDVFLSFRGTDTRHGFTGNLSKALCEKGIHTFIDDEKLQRGHEITPSLLKAIEESRIAIIVLSENYASSSFCLDELSKIIDCIKGNGRLVLPVFYNVDPSDVRKQKGTFSLHKKNFNGNMDRLLKWKTALQQVANLSGWHFKLGDEYEHEFIAKIVKEVSNKINRVPLHVAEYPVGLESQVIRVNLLLDVASDDKVHMVGIYGIGGMGKTTLAGAVYNSIADKFEGLCFLDDVRENSNKKGLVHLQEMLLSKVLGEKDIKIGSVREGISIIKHRLQQKKVLLILDDVDKLKQLQVMAGELDWFGPGSRVIITTRDRHLLIGHGIDKTYEMHGLNEKEALELFTRNAFKNKKVDPSYKEISNLAVAYASGLPLALEVIGSNLCGKDIEIWKSTLDRYKRIPPEDIQKILKVSYDGLEEEVQSVFLDIACCFKGCYLEEVQNMLHSHYGYCIGYHIGVLVEKSLIKTSPDLCNSTVTLHDLIEDMGKEIVRQESPEQPGERSRLWFTKDIVQVLEDNTGTRKIQMISMDSPLVEEVEWDGYAFKKMENLKTLIIRKGCFSEGPNHLPNSLRVLEWQRYPLQYLPSDFHAKKLITCKLPNSSFTSFKFAGLLEKQFVNLKNLNFDQCEDLRELPDVSALKNLEKFSFQDCKNLTRVHHSVGSLDKLKTLSANGCSRLRSFPPIKLTSLEQLYLSHCDSLESFPEVSEKMENIRDISLTGTPLKGLPFSFRNFTRLQRLGLSECGMFSLPIINILMTMPKLITIEVSESSLSGFQLTKQKEGEQKLSTMVSSNIEYLFFPRCNLSDEFLPLCLTWFPNVKKLHLSDCNLTIVPECIKECHFLWSLNLDDCEHLEEIRGIPPNIKDFSALNCKSLMSSSRSMLLNQELHKDGNTRCFILPGLRIPEWFTHRSSGQSISFWFPNKFPAIALCLVSQLMHKREHIGYFDQIKVTLTINGCEHYNMEFSCMFPDHTNLVDFQNLISENIAVSENKWNHVEVTFKDRDNVPIHVESGICVWEKKCNMEDVRFTDPCRKRKLEDDLNRLESQNHLLLKKHRLEDIQVSQTQFVEQLQHTALLSLQQLVSMVLRRIRGTASVKGCIAIAVYASLGLIMVKLIMQEKFYN